MSVVVVQCLLSAVFSQLYLWYNNWTNFNQTWHKQPFGVKIKGHSFVMRIIEQNADSSPLLGPNNDAKL